MWLVALGYGWWPYQTSVLQDHAWQSVSWLLPLVWQSMESTHWSIHNVLLLSRPILPSYCLLKPWFVCLSAVTYGDLLTMSQAEVPLEWIHAFYWEMGPFNSTLLDSILHWIPLFMHHNTNKTYQSLFYPYLVNIRVLTVHGMDQYHKRYCKCVKTFSVEWWHMRNSCFIFVMITTLFF